MKLLPTGADGAFLKSASREWNEQRAESFCRELITKTNVQIAIQTINACADESVRFARDVTAGAIRAGRWPKGISTKHLMYAIVTKDPIARVWKLVSMDSLFLCEFADLILDSEDMPHFVRKRIARASAKRPCLRCYTNWP